MKKTLFLITAILFLIAPFISGALFEHTIGVNVKTTEADQNLILRFMEPDTTEIFKTLSTTTDSAGNARVTLETDRDETSILILFVKNLSDFIKDENIIKEEFVGPYSTDSAITIDFNQILLEKRMAELEEQNQNTTEEKENVSSQETVSEEDVLVETQETQEIPAEEERGFFSSMGAAIFGEEGESHKRVYYGTGVMLFLVIGFFTFRRYQVMKNPREIKVKKLSDFKKEQETSSNEKAIEEAERKIQEAQEEIRKIKNQDKIAQARKKLIEDEKELMKLRKGEE